MYLCFMKDERDSLNFVSVFLIHRLSPDNRLTPIGVIIRVILYPIKKKETFCGGRRDTTHFFK